RRLARGWSLQLAADRAGLSPSGWSLIERGLRSADNRFVLASIAAALECSVADLTGTPPLSPDPAVIAADALVPAIRRALMETALAERPARQAPALPELTARVEVVRDLYRRTDYAGLGRLLPELLFDLHAALGGPDHRGVAGLSVQAHLATMAALKHMGHPTD